jgi:glycosyltransferase involved in cell wall biosynthesis
VRRSRDAARAVLAGGPLAALLGHSQLQYFGAAPVCPRDVRRCFAVHSPFVQELMQNADASPTVRQRISWRAAAWIERRILATSDVVHCDSVYTRDVLATEYPDAIEGRVVVLPGWVDLDTFRPQADRAGLRARLGAPWTPGVRTFFTLRRLVPRMGIDTLVEAAALLAQAGRDFQVIVAGEGPERQRLEALAHERRVGDRVRLVGPLAHNRVADSFAAADCFVLPTRALECFGLIVLEAYACGVPVIGVPVGSIPEVMGAEFADWVADDNAAAALASRMGDVLTGRLVADPAGLRARAARFEIRATEREHECVLLGGRDGQPIQERAVRASAAGARTVRAGR